MTINTAGVLLIGRLLPLVIRTLVSLLSNAGIQQAFPAGTQSFPHVVDISCKKLTYN